MEHSTRDTEVDFLAGVCPLDPQTGEPCEACE